MSRSASSRLSPNRCLIAPLALCHDGALIIIKSVTLATLRSQPVHLIGVAGWPMALQCIQDAQVVRGVVRLRNLFATEGNQRPGFLGQSLNKMAVEPAAVLEVDIEDAIKRRIAEVYSAVAHYQQVTATLTYIGRYFDCDALHHLVNAAQALAHPRGVIGVAIIDR